jgi:type VI secretion system protein ImpE
MSVADDLLASGDLDGARRALVEAVRRDPGHVPTRQFLWQLLAVQGDWDKAKAQLTTLAQLSPEAQMLAVVYGQAIDAEREREAVFTGSSEASVHGGSLWMRGLADALKMHATGGSAEATALRDAALDGAPDTPGEVDGAAFEWITDADARFGPCLEAIIGGRYGLLAFDAIETLVSEGPKDLRDIVWYPVEITLKAGPRVAALLPARYPGIADDPTERMARATGWRDDNTGSGQHMLALSDGEERGLLSIRSLTFR